MKVLLLLQMTFHPVQAMPEWHLIKTTSRQKMKKLFS
jgi:hypothetical protein